jgi:hypothetical protein
MHRARWSLIVIPLDHAIPLSVASHFWKRTINYHQGFLFAQDPPNKMRIKVVIDHASVHV